MRATTEIIALPGGYCMVIELTPELLTEAGWRVGDTLQLSTMRRSDGTRSS